MFEGVGSLLLNVSGSPSFSETELSKRLNTKAIAFLKANQLLKAVEDNSWFCEACDEYHLFDISTPPNLYRWCSQHFPVYREIASNEERYHWEWQWPRFRELFCEANRFTPYIQKIDSVFTLGSNATHWAAWVPLSSSKALLRQIKALRLEIVDRTIVLITPDDLLLTHDDLVLIEAQSAVVLPLIKIMNNQWKLELDILSITKSSKEANDTSINSFGKNKSKFRHLQLDTVNQRLFVSKKEEKLQTALFYTTQLLWGQKGNTLCKRDYHQLLEELSGESQPSFDLIKHIMSIRQIIKASLGCHYNSEKDAIITVPRIGYRLNIEEWFFETNS